MTSAFSFALPGAVAVSGASSGLGHAVCRLLAEAGVLTIGVDRAPALSDLLETDGYRHIQGDVTRDETWEAVAQALSASGRGSYGLVTAAAMLDVGTIIETGRDDLLRTFDVNVVGTALAFRAILPLMIAHGAGSIVAVASVDASFAEQQLAVYAASKAAVRQLARTVAMDHARQGVRVNVLSPGPMMAGLFKRHLESAADSAAFLATRSARQPGGRILEAEEVARAALFLLSDGAAALNGADLIADGGLTTSFDFRTGAEGASV
ncbi:SDR family oxidoreductase [Acidisoma cellulosilytica]|uniref:SDR family oxidoreductase n=1 Tax=Acidisoma cellulosilyticum TaxID=2802395 RepID=A0A963Z6Q8_9PROT|nr:SDR family oxidoreductase [Acidisoma cellulosilyticum]MCB8883581.1 SDR family oxidoreductase [Acidisoma cellulosilyticum]